MYNNAERRQHRARKKLKRSVNRAARTTARHLSKLDVPPADSALIRVRFSGYKTIDYWLVASGTTLGHDGRRQNAYVRLFANGTIHLNRESPKGLRSLRREELAVVLERLDELARTVRISAQAA